MIYELEGTPMRVLGTLHLMPADGTLPAWVRSAYDWSEAVFVEHSAADFLAGARLSPTGARSPVSPALARWLDTVARPSGLPVALSGLRRGAAAVLALGSRVEGVAGADQALADWCAADKRVFGHVERAADLLDALDAVTEADWTAGIRAELARPADPAAELRRIHASWRKGRLADLDRLCREGIFSVDGIRRALLTERNAHWARNFSVPSRRTLVAVGVAHLVGPSSFLDTLAAASGRPVRRLV